MFNARFGHFFWRRAEGFNSLAVPLLFIIIYILPLSFALAGKDAFDLFMQIAESLPLSQTVEWAFAAIAVFYAWNSVSLLYKSSVGPGFCWNMAGATYLVRRISMVVSSAFILHFIAVARIPYAFSPEFLDFAKFKALYGSGLFSAWFVIGYVATVFAGTSSASALFFDWGITVSERSRLAALIAAWISFVMVSAWGVRILLSF